MSVGARRTQAASASNVNDSQDGTQLWLTHSSPSAPEWTAILNKRLYMYGAAGSGHHQCTSWFASQCAVKFFAGLAKPPCPTLLSKSYREIVLGDRQHPPRCIQRYCVSTQSQLGHNYLFCLLLNPSSNLPACGTPLLRHGIGPQ